MPRMETDRFNELLKLPQSGIIATLRRDGSPYTVPIWWLWEPDPSLPGFQSGKVTYPMGEVWMVGTTNRIWCKQLQKDPRASLCIEFRRSEGLTTGGGHIEFDGECDALIPSEFDIWPMCRRLAEKFVGRDDPANKEAVDKFYDNMRTEPRMLFRMRPTTVRAIDMSVYRGKRADREFQGKGPEDD